MSHAMAVVRKSSVLIVDECPVFRFGLRQVLSFHCCCGEVGEASRSEALDSVRSRTWNVIIIGVSPHEGGLQFVEGIRAASQIPKIVFLSPPVEPQYAFKAVKAGALGYLTKEDSVPELVRGLQSVLAGHQYVSACMKKRIATATASRLPHESLSKRESHVFLALAGGKRITAIAAETGLNTKTISTYRSRVLSKMDFSSDADMVAYTIKHGLRG